MDYQKYYHIEKYLFDEVNKNFHKREYLTPKEFFAIVIWKSNRSKTNIKKGIKASEQTIKEITRKIYKAKNPIEKISILTSVKFIGIPIASAILTVCYPEKFTILDYRVWNVLKHLKKVKRNQPTTIQGYLDYIKICEKYAKEKEISLRDFDRLMWGKSFYEDLQKLVS